MDHKTITPRFFTAHFRTLLRKVSASPSCSCVFLPQLPVAYSPYRYHKAHAVSFQPRKVFVSLARLAPLFLMLLLVVHVRESLFGILRFAFDVREWHIEFA